MANNQNNPNPNQNNQNGNNGKNLPAPQEPKRNAFQRAGDKAFDKWMKFKTSKAGRWIIRGVKAVALAGVAYGSYKEGQKSVKPVIVTVKEISGEEAEKAEAQPEQEAGQEQPETEA